MIVVADTSPVLYLILIDRVDLLRGLYAEVIIPDLVAAELRASGSPSVVRTWVQSPPGWAPIRAATPGELQAITPEWPAEREAIALGFG